MKTNQPVAAPAVSTAPTVQPRAHTPGPWFCKGKTWDMRAVVERADGRYLVWVGPELTARDISGSEAEANARLIAAAPDLLAAARAVLAAWEAGDLAAATRQLTDAIARAEGHPATLRCTRCGHVADIATSETFRATSWTCPHCQPTAAKAGAK